MRGLNRRAQSCNSTTLSVVGRATSRRHCICIYCTYTTVVSLVAATFFSRATEFINFVSQAPRCLIVVAAVVFFRSRTTISDGCVVFIFAAPSQRLESGDDGLVRLFRRISRQLTLKKAPDKSLLSPAV